jgi:hypothetical protein
MLARCVSQKKACKGSLTCRAILLVVLPNFADLVRMSAFNIWHPPAFVKLIFPIVKLFLGERLRKRIRVHSGDKEHVRANLTKLGLAKDILPSDLGGEIVLDHKKWLQARAAKGL